MKRISRKDFLIVLGALALAASVVAGREKPALELAAPAERAPRAVAAVDLAALERRAADAGGADLFAPRSFAPPAPRAKRAARAAARPAPPPLPFAYVGRMLEDGKLSVFLARGAESLSVSAGERIGEDYRVEAVSDTEITFVYLPLKIKQSLPL